MLKKKSGFIVLLIALLCLGMQAAHAQQTAAKAKPQPQTAPPAGPVDDGWPRQFTKDNVSLAVFQPQIDGWVDQKKLTARVAVSLKLPGEKEPYFGAARFEADTQTDKVNRTVYIFNLVLTSVKMPAKEPALEQQLETQVRSLMPVSKPVTIALDRVLASLQLATFSAREVKVSLDPPVIFYCTTPARLVITDGKPVLVDIEKTGLQYVVNTNWDLFFDSAASKYYLLDQDTWLTASAIDGNWVPAPGLPEKFNSIPAGGNFDEARKKIAAKPAPGYVTPKIFLSDKPAELILVQGQPQFKPVPGTRLSYLANTDSDIFFHQGDRYFYVLLSGRWFRSSSPLEAKWESAQEKLPNDFAKIPADHPKSAVLASVKGTVQSEEAVLLASIPQTATLSRSEAKVEVSYAGGNPEWTQIPGTSVSYAKNSGEDVFMVDSLYYICFQGAWFIAKTPNGPWELTADVPKEIYSIPPDSPKHNVTYVSVYNTTPTTVTYGYTAGYTGMYIAFGCVMYGTGYYYPPYWGYGYHPYPIYYPHHYYSYGMAARYNPYTGAYARRAVAYGPYGGYGRSSYYNPRTGGYARGGSAWGPGGYGWGAAGGNYRTGQYGAAGGWYDAYSDRYAAGYRRGNEYAQWGERVVGQGDDWVHSGHYRDSRGTVVGAESSEGGKLVGGRTDSGSGFIAKDHDNNHYVGNDGNVYKRSNDGSWHKYENGGWNSVPQENVDRAKSEAQQRAQSRPQSGQLSESRTRPSQGSTQAATTTAQPRTSQSSSVMRDLNRDATTRSQGSQRVQQYDSWRQSGARSGWSHSPSSGRSMGGMRGRRR